MSQSEQLPPGGTKLQSGTFNLEARCQRSQVASQLLRMAVTNDCIVHDPTFWVTKFLGPTYFILFYIWYKSFPVRFIDLLKITQYLTVKDKNSVSQVVCIILERV